MKKLSDKNKKIFIKCLGILVQPATLMAPIPGVQLIAQGVIYAVSDKLIDSEKPIPDIDTVLSATKENIKQDAILILDQFDNKRELYEDLNFNTDKIANRITDKWCKDHIGQYSDSDKQEIEVAILHYLIEVQRWELSNTAFLQRVLVDHSNRISSVEERLDRQKNEIQTIKLQYEEAAYIGKEKEDSVSVFTANEQYIKSFTDPLFLHNKSGNARVNIANLFVYQKYSLIHDCDNTSLSKEPQKDIVKCIDKFLHQDRKRYLIISGDAGSGKTTLMAWINYHYSLQDLLAKKLFGDRPIITIRLRDIDRKDLSDSQDLVKAILNYMRIDSLSDFDLLFTNAIMILDGFDELCMIEAFNTNHERMLIELRTRFKNNCQFIVTTRPKFINVGLDVPSTFIHLEHFDSNLRTKWLNKYIKAVGDAETIDEKIVDYILNDEGIRTCICDTPMTLYMLMAKKGTDEFLNNNWALYHHIFYEELSETEYNEMFPNDMRDYSHDVVRIKEILYQISEEIAYLMYKKENSKFYLSQEELKGIIKELSKKNTLLENAGIKAIAENCFGICCYWKANKERGVVEFLHNDVRDFFLAEKIYRSLNTLIESFKSEGLTKEEQLAAKIAETLCQLVPYGGLETRVTEFIYFRALNNVENGIEDFASFCMQKDLIGTTLTKINQNETGENSMLEEKSLFGIVQRIINIITSTVQIYRYSSEPYLVVPNVIDWKLSKSYGNCSNAWKNLFKAIFCQVPVTISFDSHISIASHGDFSDIDLQNCDLRNIGFEHSRIHNANLCNTVLSGTDFSSASLKNTSFENSDLHYSSLKNADICGCNFTNADLRGTTLPDGYMSMDQEEQVTHLKSLRIPGLVI